MRKNYILACALLFTGLLLEAQTSSPTPTFVITGMTAPAGVEGEIYHSTKHDAEISIKARNVSDFTVPGQFQMVCMPEGSNAFQNYQSLRMVNAAGNPAGEHSYIEIHSKGAAHIEKVEFVLGASGSSYLIAAASIDGVDYLGDYLTDDLESVYTSITVENATDICNPGFSYEVPNTVTDLFGGSGTTIDDLREKVKYVRLNWGLDFAGGSSNNLNVSSILYAIKVYTNADTSITTGMENEEAENALNVTLYGRNLQLSAPADVQVYDIAGKRVAAYKQVDDAYLDSLNEGIYIIRATDSQGKQNTEKVLLR